jgi:hypothetical protein
MIQIFMFGSFPFLGDLSLQDQCSDDEATRKRDTRCLSSTSPHSIILTILLEIESIILAEGIYSRAERQRSLSLLLTSQYISHIIMQNPTGQAEAEASNNGPNLNRTVTVRRKAAKRTHPFDLAAEELHLVPSSSLSSPQAEDIQPARKKPRLEEPLPTTTHESVRKTASPDVSAGLPPPVADCADNDDTNTNADPVTDTQPNAGATTVTRRRWTLEEDAKLSSAVTNTSKKKYGMESNTNWVAVAALVPGRTKRQCRGRWRDALLSNIDPATARTGKWSEDEDIRLKDAVQTYGGKNWPAIAALIPGQSEGQCHKRWYRGLDPSIDRANERTGKWSEDEVSKLKNAVEMHGGKNWDAIAALIPGRTTTQCSCRWNNVLIFNIDRSSERTGKWSEDEVITLKNAVEMHGGKNWLAIAALVPDRTKKQCYDRWKDVSGIRRQHGRATNRKTKTSS